MRYRRSLPLILILVSHLCLAGDVAMWRAQSGKYRVEFADPLTLPSAVMTIEEYSEDDLSYTKKLPSISFQSECRATTNVIVCSPKGKSPLAGATYRRTHDGTPSCPGNAEDRFTCVSGCKASVPRYISIDPYEC